MLRVYGMQVNDNGTATYFAVLEKSSAAQKERIEKNAAKKKTEQKAKDKKAEKKAEQERNKRKIKIKAIKSVMMMTKMMIVYQTQLQ